MSFDLFGMSETAQATGVPFGRGINSVGMADDQRNNDRGGRPRLPRPTARQPTGLAMPMIEDDPFAYVMAQGERIAKVTNDAIQDEMDRRVAISREQRRMAHEMQKKRLEEETERMKIDAMLKRLEAESGYKTIVH